MINVIERIDELMKRKGWTPYELSNQTGIATNAVYDWFDIGAMPTMQSVIRICEVMGMSLEQFFCGDNNYQLTPEENKILNDWFSLSDLEKQTILKLMETFKILKTN